MGIIPHSVTYMCASCYSELHSSIHIALSCIQSCMLHSLAFKYACYTVLHSNGHNITQCCIHVCIMLLCVAFKYAYCITCIRLLIKPCNSPWMFLCLNFLCDYLSHIPMRPILRSSLCPQTQSPLSLTTRLTWSEPLWITCLPATALLLPPSSDCCPRET